VQLGLYQIPVKIQNDREELLNKSFWDISSPSLSKNTFVKVQISDSHSLEKLVEASFLGPQSIKIRFFYQFFTFNFTNFDLKNV
jgi:hypothetical protein